MSKQIVIGDVVKSLSGRDKDGFFLVVDVKDGFAYIVNGKERKVDGLKKKNLKHLEKIEVTGYPEIAIKIQRGEPVGNQKVKKLLNATIIN